MLATYRKAIVAAIPALLAVGKILVDAFGSAHVGPVDYTAVVVAVAAALGVYAVPNTANEPAVAASRVVGAITPAATFVAPVDATDTVANPAPPPVPVPLPVPPPPHNPGR
jgi:hypothetical protein